MGFVLCSVDNVAYLMQSGAVNNMIYTIFLLLLAVFLVDEYMPGGFVKDAAIF